MYFAKSIVASCLMAGMAAAQSSTMSSAMPSGSGLVTHVVKVGNAQGGLVFEPNDIKAAVGDMVQFQFYAKNHSVVQASFAQACTPIGNVNSSAASTAFFSGFMPTNATSMPQLTYTVPIKSTAPMWFYCSQGKHCQEGMVGVINQNTASANTLDAWIAKSKTAAANVSPGQNVTAGAGGAVASGSATAAGPAAGTGAAATGASSTTTSGPATSTGGAARLIQGAAAGAFGLAGMAAFFVL